MQAGRELDMRIAREVLKLKEEHGFYIDLDCPHYSTDIEDAWEVFEHLRAANAAVDLTSISPALRADGHFRCIVYWDICTKHEALGKTAPHAICLAALEAQFLLK